MKLGFVNILKFAAVVVSMVIAGSVNAWATCPTSPNYSPDFSVNGTNCLDLNSGPSLNPSASILAPVGSATSITGWTSSGSGPTATVTFNLGATDSFVAGEPVILSGFTNSPSFNTLVFPVQSITTSSFTVAFAVPSGPTSGSETTAVATPLTILQLTPSSSDQVGSAWDTTPQPVGSSFSTTFYFQLPPGASAGDGFAFVIQDSATTALGDGGCGLGFGDDGDYGSCALDTGGIPNSLAVVFKTSSSYAVSGYYPAANSVSIQTNHASPNCIDSLCNLPGAENDLTYINAPTLADGNIHSVTITSATVPSAAQTGCTAAPGNPVCLDVILDGTDLFHTGIPFAMKTIGVTTPTSTAWVGFTGATSATGFDVTSHDEANNILSWVFTPAGASTTGNVTTSNQTNFSFQGGYVQDTTTGYNFNAQLTSGSPVSAVVTAIPIKDQATCNGLVQANSLFSGAECFVYQNAGGPGKDQPVMFELTCPPAGECDSGAGTFPATLGSEFPFLTTDDGSNDNLNLTLGDFPSDPLSPAWTPAMTTALNGGYPGVGLLKGQGPDPIHPCTPFSGINPPPLFQSNQISAFVLDPDTSGGAKAQSGNTNSCWVVTYLTPSELPTVSITAPANNGNYPLSNTAQTAHYTCNAINTSPALTGPYLTVDQCTGPGTFDTSTLGPQTYTAYVTDSALNSNYQTVTYNVQEAPTFTNANGTTTTFTVGTLGTPFNITTTAYPVATLSASGLPGGLTYRSNSDGSITISGTPSAGTGGSYNVLITASNTTGTPPMLNSPTEYITVVVDQAPAFTSAASTTFTLGSPGSFTATASGYTAPTIAENGLLPTGVTASGGTISGTPTQSGTFPITFTATNGTGNPATQNFTLKVSAVNSLLISPTSLIFPPQNNNTKSLAQKVTLTNQGSNTITISSIKIPGSNVEGSANDADDFTFTKTCGSSLAAGASCYVYVTFGADNDNLAPTGSLVFTDSATGSPQSVGLSASVLDPLISLSASSMSFGTVTPPATASKTVTVKNSGLTQLNFTGLTISPNPNFALAGTCTPTTSLPKGGTCTISVTFAPPTTTKNTNYSGTVTITSNALNGATEKISLSGTGK